ncbi:MAG: hypothetical protein H6582_03195 [Crocinitomicaceae bacterium]|nr:hypothetical protein [Crocinitomicaceae bacterium]
MNKMTQYNLLADLFRYPQNGYIEDVNKCADYLKENYPVAYQQMLPFIDVINGMSIIQIEELFGRTFHIQAICYLDIGYVLFAEDYKRGEFLVQMKNEQRKVNNDCGVELSDNLPNALTLLPLLEDSEFREELVVRMYIPALEMMLKEFDTARMQLKDKVRKKKQKVVIQENLPNMNIYKFAIEATLSILQLDFEISEFEGKEINADPLSSFLPNCEGSCVETKPSEKKK